MRCHHRRRNSQLVVAGGMLAAAAVVWPPAGAARGGERPPTEKRPVGMVVSSCMLPSVMLAPATADEPAVMLGGISDLWVERLDAGRRRAWVVTDRGPNGLVTVDGTERRTLVSPSFTPRIVEFTIGWDPSHPARLSTTVTGTIILRDSAGEPLSGRPNGVAGDPRIVDPGGTRSIAADPDGVDTEGLVRMKSGVWWLAEEYRPSLLAATADGFVRQRFVPAGLSLSGAGMTVSDALPAVYAERRDNRGFEALAIAPDESRIFALVQSPLERPDRATAERCGNVRLVSFDPAGGAMAAEHVYRLGEPTRRRRRREHAPADGKLCAMAAVGPTTLLVLEQANGGVARLYLVELDAATDTLSRTRAGDDPPLESLEDLAAENITPVRKTLLADLGPALDAMRAQAGLRGEQAGALKIEGLAIADERHVFLVNDDDFGVREDAEAGPAHSRLWAVRLPRSLSLTSP